MGCNILEFLELKDLIKFSFIIPIYNCANSIELVVNNILEINSVNIEILLIDDGSTDGSSNICDKLVKKNDVVKCYHQENKGVSYARNIGINYSKGEYILFVDADDNIDSEGLSILMSAISESSNVDMIIFGHSFDYYYQGALYRRENMLPALNGINSRDICMEKIDSLYKTESLSPIWNKIIKASIIKDNNAYFNEELFQFEDLDFSLRCISLCDKILFSHEILYHYKQAENKDKAKSRLLRINNLSTIVIDLEETFYPYKTNKVNKDKIKFILKSIYFLLANEKIDYVSYKDIKQICYDFKNWCDTNEIKILNNDRLLRLMYENKSIIIYFRKFYLSFRRLLSSIKKHIMMRNA